MESKDNALSQTQSDIRRIERGSHDNNLSLVRLVLAVMVIFSHSYPLSGQTPRSAILLEFGRIAVDGFFLISGYLITQSWFRSRSAGDFFVKRVARIYPGYIVAFFFSAVVAALFSGGTPLHYLKHLLPVNDLALRSLLFLDYGCLDSPYAFPGNPVPGAVNGSLWTLQPELLCYMLVLGAGAFNGFAKRWRILFVPAAAIVCMVLNQAAHRDTVHLFWRFLSYFGTGTAFFLYRDRLRLSYAPLLLGSAACLAAAFFVPLLAPVVSPVAGGYLLFSLGFAKAPKFLPRMRGTDLSYGVYIYAFPVQQVCVAVLGMHRALPLFIVSLPIVGALAFLSWHFVEHPMLAASKPRKSNAGEDFPIAVAAPTVS